MRGISSRFLRALPGVALAIAAIAVLIFTRHKTFTPGGGGREELASILLDSSSIQAGRIPATFTCDGTNLSPALAWSGVPEGTKSFALIVSDRDSPEGPFVHWILFNLPPETRSLPEAIGTAGLPNGALEGRNDFGRTGYGGPCPPDHSPHHYQFYLFALDSTLDLPSGAALGKIEQAVEGHVLAHGTLTATYSH